MKKIILNVDLYDGKSNIISENEFEETLEYYGERFEDEFSKEIGINGVVSYRGEEEMYIIIGGD